MYPKNCVEKFKCSPICLAIQSYVKVYCVYFRSFIVKTSCNMKDHFTFMLTGGLQGDILDPDGDVSCNQTALLLLIIRVYTCVSFI